MLLSVYSTATACHRFTLLRIKKTCELLTSLNRGGCRVRVVLSGHQQPSFLNTNMRSIYKIPWSPWWVYGVSQPDNPMHYVIITGKIKLPRWRENGFQSAKKLALT